MAERNDLEHNKFTLSSGVVILNAVPGVGPGTAIFSGNIDELEQKKFTSLGEVRTITTF